MIPIYQISVIVTAHHEGRLAHRTMKSVFNAMKHAENNDVVTEVIVVLDKPDKKTTDYFAKYWSSKINVVTVDYGDPGLSRNYGVSIASGKFIALLDADDLFGSMWLLRAYHESIKLKNNAILHPELLVVFEGQNQIARFRGTEDSEFNVADLIENNGWTSLLFAERAILIENPFVATPLDSGFGYEDWHWYCESIAKGVEVKIVKDACAFIRRKTTGSRVTIHNQSQVIIPPTILFNPAVFRSIAKNSPLINQAKNSFLEAIPSRNTSIKSIVSTYTDPIFNRYPRLYPWIVKHIRTIKQLGESHPSIFPDWLIEEWKSMHSIEPQIFPEQQLLEHVPFYTIPHSRIGSYYLHLCNLFGVDVSQVFLVPWLNRGGADLVVLNYVEALLKIDPERKIAVISTLDADSPWTDRLPKGVSFIEFGRVCAGLTGEEQEKLLTRLLIQLAPQVVHNINSELGYKIFVKYGKALSSISNLFACSFCKDVSEEGKDVGYPFSYLPDCFDNLVAVFSDNQSFLERLHETYAFDRQKLFTHYQPFQIAERRAYFDKIAGKHHMDVLWAGRIDRQKRPDILAGIAEACLDSPFRFHVYGSALLDRDIYTDRLKNLTNVTFHGPYDGLPSLPTTIYDLFLYTSQWDGLPNILLEAVSLGLPIVASNVGAVGELIRPGETGYLIEPYDNIAVYVQCLKNIYQDRSALPSLVANAYDLVESRHSWESFIKCLEVLPEYSEL